MTRRSKKDRDPAQSSDSVTRAFSAKCSTHCVCRVIKKIWRTIGETCTQNLTCDDALATEPRCVPRRAQHDIRPSVPIRTLRAYGERVQRQRVPRLWTRSSTSVAVKIYNRAAMDGDQATNKRAVYSVLASQSHSTNASCVVVMLAHLVAYDGNRHFTHVLHEYLEDLHKLGMIHTDVKPDNIMLQRYGIYTDCCLPADLWSSDLPCLNIVDLGDVVFSGSRSYELVIGRPLFLYTVSPTIRMLALDRVLGPLPAMLLQEAVSAIKTLDAHVDGNTFTITPVRRIVQDTVQCKLAKLLAPIKD
ncbi:hypothetical protein C8Q80DRAFT_1122975 [Daedaleopsis nitida]|nr:hypothetical protein C8Q80DRAFT_1122975 [Daedaleopsis nitida]